MSKRFTHYIKKAKRQVFPRYCIFVDTETKQIPFEENSIRQELFLGVAQYRDYESKGVEDEIIFKESSTFWTWVCSKCNDRKKVYIFAHNQDFDFRVLQGFSSLRYMGFTQGKMICESNVWILDYKYDDLEPVWYKGKQRRTNKNFRCTLSFLDTTNWFKASLASLGKIIGCKKTIMPSYEEPFETWVAYCRQDVNVLRRVFENYVDFLKKEDMGNFGFTLAKQALNTFKHRFMKHDILVHCNKKATELERLSYYGGRTECFYIGKEKKDYYFKVDINSMYPAVMQSNVFPTKLICQRRLVSVETKNYLNKNYKMIARCHIETKETCVPFRHNNRLCFPTGSFEATLCQPEIDLALSRGCSVDIIEAAYYECQPVFRDWVDHFYPLRKRLQSEGNKQYELFVKLIMNSLYGKFGQRNTSWEQIDILGNGESWYRIITDLESGVTQTLKSVDGTVYEQQGVHDGFDTIVSMASFVTSYARVVMYKLILLSGLQNCYYCDTDSLIVNRAGFENLQSEIDDNKLGYLKLEAHDNVVEIQNLKDYTFAGETKLKGVPRKSILQDDGSYLCEQWEHMNGAIHKQRLETVVTGKVRKMMKREYKKGVIQHNGRVTPFEFPRDLELLDTDIRIGVENVIAYPVKRRKFIPKKFRNRDRGRVIIKNVKIKFRRTAKIAR